jgi:hypothetical protein
MIRLLPLFLILYSAAAAAARLELEGKMIVMAESGLSRYFHRGFFCVNWERAGAMPPEFRGGLGAKGAEALKEFAAAGWDDYLL